MVWALPFLKRGDWAWAVGLSVAGCAAVLWWAPHTALGLVAFAVAAFGGPLAVCDMRHHLLPNILVAPLGAVNFGIACWACWVAGSAAPLAAVGACVGGVALVTAVLLRTRSQALGMGDLKLAGALALGLGVGGPLIFAMAVAAGVILAGVWATLLLAARRVRRAGYIALGPWLVGGVLALLPLWDVA